MSETLFYNQSATEPIDNWAYGNWASGNWAYDTCTYGNWVYANWAYADWAYGNWASGNRAYDICTYINWACANWACDTWSATRNLSAVDWQPRATVGICAPLRRYGEDVSHYQQQEISKLVHRLLNSLQQSPRHERPRLPHQQGSVNLSADS